MLQELSKLYTPFIFELFQEKFNKYIAACIKKKIESKTLWEYVIFLFNKERDYKMTLDPHDKLITRSCRKFESMGLLCCHASKVYDMNDVKFLSDQYILNCLTRKAKDNVIYVLHKKKQ